MRVFCSLASKLRPWIRQALAESHKALARFCQRFSPLVGLDGVDGLTLDIRGLPRLYGGEEAILDSIKTALEDLGLTAHLAIADTNGAAWALAHYGRSGTILPPNTAEQALAAFPVEALRPSPETAQALHRLGIKTIGSLKTLPRAQLTRQYGREVLGHLEQALGRHGEPLEPLPPSKALSARLRFPELLGLLDDLMLATEKLVEHLCQCLTADQMGLTRLRLEVEIPNGQIKTRDLGFAQPTRDAALILCLVEGKVETLESEFGFDSLRPAALTTAPLGNQQETLMEETQGQAEALLLAILGNRLGFERLQRHIPQPTHLPDREVAARPVLSKPHIQDLSALLSPRPILRFPMPEPIEELDKTEAKTGPPRQFRWRRKTRTTLNVTGPERICPPWWRTEPDWHSTRDYWCVQTSEGPRLWLYQSAKPARWYVAGELS